MGLNILVIESDRVKAEVIAATIAKNSFVENIDTATSKRQVQTHLFNTVYDLIILDFFLGDTRASSLLAEFREIVGDSKIYLVSKIDDLSKMCNELISDGFNVVGWQRHPFRSQDVQELLEKIA